MTIQPLCPVCGNDRTQAFLEIGPVPVQSVRLIPTRAEALDFPRGDIRLAACPECGFIFNSAFREELLRYAPDYEATQSCSPTFNTFHRELAADLVHRYRLKGKPVVEIGCGRGEFLRLLLEQGIGRGIGFDPVAEPTGRPDHPADRLVLIPHPFPAGHARLDAHMVCCKMTLEHIPRPVEFLRAILHCFEPHAHPVYFIQVPHMNHIVSAAAFWDIYYEHCSYFTRSSLVRLLKELGCEVLAARTAYDDQYLLAEARAGGSPAAAPSGEQPPLDGFSAAVQAAMDRWRARLLEARARGRRAVLWSSGSKAVAFLNLLKLGDEVAGVVDINPKRQGTFLAGTGHEIISPESLRNAPPDQVIVMNPIYTTEIRARLDALGLRPELLELK
jgi:hypothetical protein